MPVFNTAAHVIPAQPVSAYYEGKATRANIAATEKDTELAEERMAIAKSMERRLQEQHELDTEKHEFTLTQHEQEQMRSVIAAGVTAYDNALKQGGSTEDAGVAGHAGLLFALDQITPGGGDEAGVRFRDEFGLTPETFPDVVEAYRGYLGGELGGEGFTLKEGDVRFDAEGNPVARNPKTPAQTSYAPTDLQKELEPLVDRGYLSREEADKIYLDKATRLPGSDDARSRKIQDYIELFNVDEARATKLVDGKLKMEINDATGRMILTDQITQQSWEIPISDTNVFVPAPKPGRTLWDMKEWATGPASALKAWWNVPAAIMDMPVDQRVTNARQGFATANQELIRSLAINPRFPVAEQERIKEEISVGSQFFDHPTLMRERMISLRNSLTTRMQQAERDANDPNLNEDLRSAQQSNVTTIQNYLAVLGVPAEGSEDVPFIVNGESDYADVPPGAWYQWNNQLRRKSE